MGCRRCLPGNDFKWCTLGLACCDVQSKTKDETIDCFSATKKCKPKRLPREIRNFNRIPCQEKIRNMNHSRGQLYNKHKTQFYLGHAGGPRRVERAGVKTQLYLHSAPSTRAMFAEGRTSTAEDASLPAFRAFDTLDLRRALRGQP